MEFGRLAAGAGTICSMCKGEKLIWLNAAGGNKCSLSDWGAGRGPVFKPFYFYWIVRDWLAD